MSVSNEWQPFFDVARFCFGRGVTWLQIARNFEGRYEPHHAVHKAFALLVFGFLVDADGHTEDFKKIAIDPLNNYCLTDAKRLLCPADELLRLERLSESGEIPHWVTRQDDELDVLEIYYSMTGIKPPLNAKRPDYF